MAQLGYERRILKSAPLRARAASNLIKLPVVPGIYYASTQPVT